MCDMLGVFGSVRPEKVVSGRFSLARRNWCRHKRQEGAVRSLEFQRPDAVSGLGEAALPPKHSIKGRGHGGIGGPIPCPCENEAEGHLWRPLCGLLSAER